MSFINLPASTPSTLVEELRKTLRDEYSKVDLGEDGLVLSWNAIIAFCETGDSAHLATARLWGGYRHNVHPLANDWWEEVAALIGPSKY
jgi:hypothetical protein